MKSRFTLLTAALLLAGAAHAGSLKSLPLDDTGCAENLKLKSGQRYRIDSRSDDALLTVDGDTGFAVRNAKGRRLPSELGHDGDSGAAFRFVELNKGRYTFSVSKSGTVKRICVNAAN